MGGRGGGVGTGMRGRARGVRGHRGRKENLLHLVFTVTRFNNEEFAERARLSPAHKSRHLDL